MKKWGRDWRKMKRLEEDGGRMGNILEEDEGSRREKIEG